VNFEENSRTAQGVELKGIGPETDWVNRIKVLVIKLLNREFRYGCIVDGVLKASVKNRRHKSTIHIGAEECEDRKRHYALGGKSEGRSLQRRGKLGCEKTRGSGRLGFTENCKRIKEKWDNVCGEEDGGRGGGQGVKLLPTGNRQKEIRPNGAAEGGHQQKRITSKARAERLKE